VGLLVASRRAPVPEPYRVGSGFARLVPATFPGGLPVGVVDVAYSVDTSACRPWLVSDVPTVGPLAALQCAQPKGDWR